MVLKSIKEQRTAWCLSQIMNRDQLVPTLSKQACRKVNRVCLSHILVLVPFFSLKENKKNMACFRDCKVSINGLYQGIFHVLLPHKDLQLV